MLADVLAAHRTHAPRRSSRGFEAQLVTLAEPIDQTYHVVAHDPLDLRREQVADLEEAIALKMVRLDSELPILGHRRASHHGNAERHRTIVAINTYYIGTH